MNGRTRTFVGDLIPQLNAVALHAVAYARGGDNTPEVAVLGPNAVSAYQSACELLGYHMQMSKAQEVVIMKAASFKALCALAELETVPWDLASQAQPPAPPRLKPIKKVGRRRRQIFDESGGKCHYCACELELEGKWHIEHKFPVALGGGDEDDNLVAACVPCNMKKRDRTDREFLATLKGVTA